MVFVFNTSQTTSDILGMKLTLNFPVFLTVTPLANNTVERAICIWISNFSSLVTYVFLEIFLTRHLSVLYTNA